MLTEYYNRLGAIPKKGSHHVFPIPYDMPGFCRFYGKNFSNKHSTKSSSLVHSKKRVSYLLPPPPPPPLSDLPPSLSTQSHVPMIKTPETSRKINKNEGDLEKTHDRKIIESKEKQDVPKKRNISYV